MNVLLCSYGSYVLFATLSDEYQHLLREEFLDENTRTVVQGEPMVVVRYLIHEESILIVLFVLCVGMGIALVCFSGFHLYLVSNNLTTNEFFKRRELRRSHMCPCTHKYDLGSAVLNWREVWEPRYKAKIFAVKLAASKRSDHQKGARSFDVDLDKEPYLLPLMKQAATTPKPPKRQHDDDDKSGERYFLDQIKLLRHRHQQQVTNCEQEHETSAWMEFEELVSPEATNSTTKTLNTYYYDFVTKSRQDIHPLVPLLGDNADNADPMTRAADPLEFEHASTLHKQTSMKNITKLEILCFHCWWKETSLQGETRQCRLRLYFSIPTRHFQVVLEDSPNVFTISHVAHAVTGVPLSVWDLHEGARITVLGRPTTLRQASLLTRQWLEIHERRLRPIMEQLQKELAKYELRSHGRSAAAPDNPGPGSYLRPSSSPPSNNQREHQGLRKFAHLIKPSVPTIPQRQQSYGYVQVGVELQRQSAPEKIYSGVGHDTVGPAAYSRHNSIWNEKKNGAPSLKSTAKREVWEENKRLTSLPGPGQYNTNSVPEITVVTTPLPAKSIPEGQRPRIGARRSQHRGTRQSAVFASKVPILQAPKPVGVYDPEREQELLAKEERAERYRQEHNKLGGYGTKTEAFGSTTGRTELTSHITTPFSNPSYTTTPGPGRYGTARSNPSSKQLGRKTSGVLIPHHRAEGIGFSCATERPCLAPTKTPSAPGPGAYRSETPRSLNQNVRGKLCIGRNGVFGTTSERQVWSGDEFTPGPGAYSEAGSFDTRHYLNSAAFKSGSTRFAKNALPHAPPHVHCVGDQATPAVGQYNVSKGFSAVASSVPEVASASDAAEFLSPRVPFLSTQERSVFDTKDVCDLPGPGAYKDNVDDTGAYTRSRDLRLTVGNEARFRVKPTVPVTVGPGAYSIPGTVGTKSFNVTMTPKDKVKSGPTRARGSPTHKTSPRTLIH
ncbi:hypothetical protein PPTG_14989 [Phytophthora nicotianae INRA-310]|uniref:Palmitoyltransferase n=1 Tax=Phytophthora nicotianae (strain INRA-310) TaxID=761204 RepID=W2PVR1_PHYN3|nr:hypothetical protein PPTG_14989 [Phytophthora nicotianae INRA-310]ETN04294.1 hypothetical protein PPTG_14989 [Phytophthora nicotianae INRA-310]